MGNGISRKDVEKILEYAELKKLTLVETENLIVKRYINYQGKPIEFHLGKGTISSQLLSEKDRNLVNLIWVLFGQYLPFKAALAMLFGAQITDDSQKEKWEEAREEYKEKKKWTSEYIKRYILPQVKQSMSRYGVMPEFEWEVGRAAEGVSLKPFIEMFKVLKFPKEISQKVLQDIINSLPIETIKEILAPLSPLESLKNELLSKIQENKKDLFPNETG